MYIIYNLDYVIVKKFMIQLLRPVIGCLIFFIFSSGIIINPTQLSDCTCKGKKLYGRIQIVNSFPDLKVQVVNSFPDLKVQVVNSFPDACGKWQFVESFPDLKIQFVESFPDIKIQYVKSFPGLR
jgi:hypothetical protein